MKHYFLFLLVALGVLTVNSANAVDPTYTSIFSDKAIKGYDTVAYFTENQAVEGRDAFQAEYNGATWLFSSAENLALFEQDPAKYAPQYGGYCAYAVANNSTASIQPELFTVHNGKLYLNYNESVNKKWSADKENFIAAADRNWPALLAE